MTTTHDAMMDVIELLKKARQAEADCSLELADAEAFTERVRNVALAEAYQHGQIDGKNAETRKIQEAQFLIDQLAIREAMVKEREIRSKHVAARIDREYQSDRLAALLALCRHQGNQE